MDSRVTQCSRWDPYARTVTLNSHTVDICLEFSNKVGYDIASLWARTIPCLRRSPKLEWSIVDTVISTDTSPFISLRVNTTMADETAISIKIKKLGGTTAEFVVQRTLLVRDLKQMLVESSGLPVEGQKLIFMGKVLQDQNTLESYGIKDASVLHLVANRPAPVPDTPVQPPTQPAEGQNAHPGQQQGFRFVLNPQDFVRMVSSTLLFDPLTIERSMVSPFLKANHRQFPVNHRQHLNQQTGLNPQQLPGVFQQLLTSIIGIPGQPPQPGQANPQAPQANVQGQPQANAQGQPQANAQGQPQANAQGQPMFAPPGMMHIQIQQQGAVPQTIHLQPNGNPNAGQGQPPRHPGMPLPANLAVNLGVPQLVQNQNMQGRSPDNDLDVAVVAGDLERVRAAVQRGANVNRGALHRAIAINRPEIVRWLLSNGAHPETKIGNHESPIHTASFFGHIDLIRLLIEEQKVNLWERNTEGMTSLMLAVYNNHLPSAEYLIQAGANVHDNEPFGSTPLIISAQKGYQEMTDMLLRHGALSTARDARGRTALHFAACTSTGIVRSLVEAGAPVNAVNGSKESPLHYAAFHNQKESIEFLISRGAQVNITSSGGTPLQLAMAKGFQEVAELLRRHGAQ
ncbi:ankyrin repeat protein [Planoprotostelium fungivorum]|uniref:Ankyrin repeat protein n=1 Tax=Planoprotostelium fungivorum TaxID=1890364 RepID=A0A2P6N6B8_9EUKA|nr:ankyrin repeat protein [Planoprotostelium fungivorum]